MALSISKNKLALHIIQNFRVLRPFTSKFVSRPGPRMGGAASASKQASAPTDQHTTSLDMGANDVQLPTIPEYHQSGPATANAESSGLNFRYAVCQERSVSPSGGAGAGNASSLSPLVAVGVQENSQRQLPAQSLQPAMLPEFYQKQGDPVALPVCQAGRNLEFVQKRAIFKGLEASKTYKSVTLPLKPIKLANPFPEPIKTMHSQKVADDEKAELMLSESRQNRFSTNLIGSGGIGMSPTLKREYSSYANTVPHQWRTYAKQVGKDAKKCKKLGDKKSRDCPKCTIPGCPTVNPNIGCEKFPVKIKCKKQLAPYPAYSEFCHEEVIEKPSECKMCPWSTEMNPNFKPPKKEFHTSSSRVNGRVSVQQRASDSALNSEPERKPTNSSASTTKVDVWCGDLHKGQCPPPNNNTCKERERKEKERAQKRGRSSSGNRDKGKSKKASWTQLAKVLAQKQQQLAFEQSYTFLSNDFWAGSAAPSLGEFLASGGGCKKRDPNTGKEKCTKIPFPKCNQPIRRPKVDGPCPPKPKRKPVQDCPGDEKGGTCKTQAFVTYKAPVPLWAAMKPAYKMDKKKKKCPEVDMTINKGEEDDDPCRLKRKGVTLECPGDLLEKKRRKPKKPRKLSRSLTSFEECHVY